MMPVAAVGHLGGRHFYCHPRHGWGASTLALARLRSFLALLAARRPAPSAHTHTLASPRPLALFAPPPRRPPLSHPPLKFHSLTKPTRLRPSSPAGTLRTGEHPPPGPYLWRDAPASTPAAGRYLLGQVRGRHRHRGCASPGGRRRRRRASGRQGI